MRSFTLAAVLIVATLPVAAAAHASDKDIVVPRSPPAADLKSYTQYEDVLDRIALPADKSATQQKSLKEQLVGAWTLPAADQGQQGGYIPNPFD